MRAITPLVLVALALGPARVARAQTIFDAAAPDDIGAPHRWSFGLQLEPLDLPRGHLGIPLQGTEDGFHLGAAFSLRYQPSTWWAVVMDLGTPTSALGPAVWVGHEVFHRLWANPHGVAVISVYEAVALEVGFAGPDYFARRDGTFVGYGYAFGGPPSVALRLPIGLRVDWWRSRFDTYVEGGALLAAAPSVETFVDLSVGGRFHF
jgi:hypothetical protein